MSDLAPTDASFATPSAAVPAASSEPARSTAPAVQTRVGEMQALLDLGALELARTSLVVKRTFDLLMAACALLFCAPLLIALMVLIRADTPGPALFRQQRLGRDRRPFTILKLRTMHHLPAEQLPLFDTPLNPMSRASDPSQITRLGRVLRRTAIDELPQLINVLRGEMSLVGPRPFVPAECAGLPGWSEGRFTVRPGLTGAWQVSGQHALSLEELCGLDVAYARSCSFRQDLRILARTPARLMRGSG